MNARTPPRRALDEIGAALHRAGIAYALGGSGLLMAHGLVDGVHDWDLTTDADLGQVRTALGGFRWTLHGSSGVHADHKFTREDRLIEVIVRFSFLAEGAICHIPTIVAGEHQGVPLGSLECWAVAYALMGRGERSERVFAYVASRGASAPAIARLLEEPLPAAIVARLRVLPAR